MANRPPRSARADLYTRVTTDIIAAIEAGAHEWRMLWHHDGSNIARPRNVASDRNYRGINVLALWAAARRAGFASGIWGTYRQRGGVRLPGSQRRNRGHGRVLEADRRKQPRRP